MFVARSAHIFGIDCLFCRLYYFAILAQCETDTRSSAYALSTYIFIREKIHMHQVICLYISLQVLYIHVVYLFTLLCILHVNSELKATPGE